MKKLLLLLTLFTTISAFINAQVVFSSVMGNLDEASASTPENYDFIPNDHLGAIAPFFLQSQLGGGTFNVQVVLADAGGNDAMLEVCGFLGQMYFPYALDSGEVIGPTAPQGSWHDGPTAPTNPALSFTLFHKTISPLLPSSGCATTPFIAGTRKYMGMKIASNGSASSIHYGWADIEVNATGSEVIIHGWAYETLANTPIIAGSTVSGSGTQVTGITVQGQGGATAITTAGGTLQMEAAILPLDASDSSVTWSSANGTGSAIIDAAGMLSAFSDGDVTVTATANDGSGITGSAVITLSSGGVGINDGFETNFTIYPNPTSNDVKVELSANNSNATVEIINVFGKVLKTTNYRIINKVLKQNLGMNDLESGSYLIKITLDNEKTYFDKVIKF